jgi:hypothetical protein
MMFLRPLHRGALNSGNELLMKWASDSDNNEYIMSDQPMLNYLVNHLKFDVINLGHKYNHTIVIKDPKTRFKRYFIHYAGLGGLRNEPRMNQMGFDGKVMTSPFGLMLSQHFNYIDGLLTGLLFIS